MTNIARVHFSASLEANPLKLKMGGTLNFAESIAPSLFKSNTLTHVGNNVLQQGTHFSVATPSVNRSVLDLPVQHVTAPSAQLQPSNTRTAQLASEMTHHRFTPASGALVDFAVGEVNGTVSGIKNLLALPTKVSNAVTALASTDLHTLNAAMRNAKTDFVSGLTAENLLAKVKDLNGTELAVGLLATVTTTPANKVTSGVGHLLDGVTDAVTKARKSGMRPDGSIPKNGALSKDALQHETNRAAAIRDWANLDKLQYEARRRDTMSSFYEGADERFKNYVDSWRRQNRDIANEFRANANGIDTKLNVELIKARASKDPKRIQSAERDLARHQRQVRDLDVRERFENAVFAKPNGEPVVRSGD